MRVPHYDDKQDSYTWQYNGLTRIYGMCVYVQGYGKDVVCISYSSFFSEVLG